MVSVATKVVAWKWHVGCDDETSEASFTVLRDVHGVEVAARGMTEQRAEWFAAFLNFMQPTRCEWRHTPRDPQCAKSADHPQGDGFYCGDHCVGGG